MHAWCTTSLLTPDASLSSDFIAGFCGETEEEHHDTITLLEAVKFDMAYMFAYSMRKVYRPCGFLGVIFCFIQFLPMLSMLIPHKGTLHKGCLSSAIISVVYGLEQTN